MTVQELIERLSEFGSDAEVMIIHGFNGGGSLRDLNFGPAGEVIGVADDTEEVRELSGDCDDRVGEAVVVIGFGCY